MLKKIIISGSVFSGKQTAIHILDNNQDIMINLIHDCMINALKYFYSLNNVENNSQGNKLIIFKKDNKKIELTEKNFNDSLEHTNFNKTIKKYADEGKIPNKFSNLKNEYYNFNFNFERFRNNFFNDIFDHKNKEIYSEEFIDLFLLNFFKEKEGKSYEQLKSKTFAFKAPNDQESIDFILQEKFNCKIIYVERDISGLIKSRAQAYVLNHKNEEKLDIDKVYNWMVNSKFVDKIKKENEKIKSHLNKEIYITSLEKLVYETENEKKKINKFLNLDLDLLKNQSPKHFNKINDDEIIVNEKNEKFLYYRYYDFKYIFGNFKINIFLRYTLFNFKKLILKIFN